MRTLDSDNVEMRICGTLLSPPDNRDYIFDDMITLDEDISELGSAGDENEIASGIGDIDINTFSEISPYPQFARSYENRIRSQGSQGSCAAMAVAAMKEGQEYKENSFVHYMSPQFIYDSRPIPESTGMTVRSAMKILMKKGICPEYAHIYGFKAPITASILRQAENFRIASYARIISMQALRHSIANNGPAIMVVAVYNYGTSMWKPEFGSQQLIGYHAMAVVGYNPWGFMIRNSWGTDWGVDGYAFILNKDFNYIKEIWTCVDVNSHKLNISATEVFVRSFILKAFGTKI